jgi:hypothetical protein
MRQFALCMAVALLAFMPAWADDPPKEEKKELTAKEQYQALVKEFQTKQSELIRDINKAKGEDQQKLIQNYRGLGKEYAERFFKIAEDNAKDPVATDALLWVVQNASGSDEYAKATEKVTAWIGETPVKDLLKKLATIRGANNEIMTAVMKRAENEENATQAADLLGWAAMSNPISPSGQKAVKLLVEKDPDHKSVGQLCVTLGFYGYNPQSVKVLKTILEKSTKDATKAAAAMSLGKALYSHTDSLADKPAEADQVAAEAEKYFTQVIEEFGKDNAAQKKEAEKELHCLRTLRIGKEAPQIEGGDLEGTEFKLTDYRGKVVMLDFWGHW